MPFAGRPRGGRFNGLKARAVSAAGRFRGRRFSALSRRFAFLCDWLSWNREESSLFPWQCVEDRMVQFRTDVRPASAELVELFRAAQLNRPLGDPERISRMYAASNLVVTAWEGERLVGVLRGWTDDNFDGYICDLAVHPEFQKLGVGRALLDAVRRGRPQVQFVVRASAIAREYYQGLGWQKIENGWFWPRQP
jgi:GNAT superfamily N-acetyltransferase